MPTCVDDCFTGGTAAPFGTAGPLAAAACFSPRGFGFGVLRPARRVAADFVRKRGFPFVGGAACRSEAFSRSPQALSRFLLAALRGSGSPVVVLPRSEMGRLREKSMAPSNSRFWVAIRRNAATLWVLPGSPGAIRSAGQDARRSRLSPFVSFFFSEQGERG